VIGEAGRADAGAFLVRLLRLDPAALARLRPSRTRPGFTEIWAMLPFAVLVTRMLPVAVEADITVAAADILDTLRDPAVPPAQRRDEAWRWPLPPSRGRPIETIPAEEIVRVAQAASRTLRSASEHGVGGRAVGERVARDALLDHVPIVVTDSDGARIDVPQRLVQAVVRMGFLPISSAEAGKSVTLGDNLITVRLSSGWICLDALHGSAWYRPSSALRLTPGLDVPPGPFG
jgi:hypothetical protein